MLIVVIMLGREEKRVGKAVSLFTLFLFRIFWLLSSLPFFTLNLNQPERKREERDTLLCEPDDG